MQLGQMHTLLLQWTNRAEKTPAKYFGNKMTLFEIKHLQSNKDMDFEEYVTSKIKSDMNLDS